MSFTFPPQSNVKTSRAGFPTFAAALTVQVLRPKWYLELLGSSTQIAFKSQPPRGGVGAGAVISRCPPGRSSEISSRSVESQVAERRPGRAPHGNLSRAEEDPEWSLGLETRLPEHCSLPALPCPLLVLQACLSHSFPIIFPFLLILISSLLFPMGT